MNNKQSYKVNENISALSPNRKYRGGGHPVKTRGFILIILSILFLLPVSCSERTDSDKEIKRTLTPDERYLVRLYIKIHDFERNLQNNPEELSKKLNQVRQDVDYQRIERTISELEKDPTRWLAVYNRINELLTRDSKTPGN